MEIMYFNLYEQVAFESSLTLETMNSLSLISICWDKMLKIRLDSKFGFS